MHPLLRSAPTPMLCLSALFFVLALALPFFWMEPGFGDPILEEFLELLFGESFDAKPYSVLGGIWILFADGDWVIAIVLLLFSVLFPIGKLLALFILLFWPNNRAGKYVDWLKRLGPWSMMDVFVVSVTVLAFKSFPGGTRVTVGVGYYLFLISVVLAMIATSLIKVKLVHAR